MLYEIGAKQLALIETIRRSAQLVITSDWWVSLYEKLMRRMILTIYASILRDRVIQPLEAGVRNISQDAIEAVVRGRMNSLQDQSYGWTLLSK